ncbi:MAG: DUF2145 domain-containing protein [Gammaproteobacteria bacterium]
MSGLVCKLTVHRLCWAVLASLWVATCAHAASLRYCDQPQPASAEPYDQLLHMTELVKAELEHSGQRVAVMSRSGLDLRRFGQRYSHAGVSLQANTASRWAVRQLYYACDEQRPRLYDQGVAGFVFGTDNPQLGYVSVVFLPAAAADQLEQAALDNQQALSLLAPVYSANAYAFSVRYQNCNQWVIELLAAAWGRLPDPADSADPRASAQRWLLDQRYRPSEFSVHNPLLTLASHFVKWVHSDDHPQEAMQQARYRVSMPASIETFIHTAFPDATRMEFCHNQQHMVIHHGWDALADNCEPGEQDTVMAFD